MPGIENLNFEVILDYSKFNKEIKTVKDLARGLNKDVSEALNLKKKISDADAKLRVNAEKIAQAEQKTAQEAAKTATAKAKQELSEQKLADYSKKTSDNTEKTKVATQQTNTHLASMQSIMLTLSRLTGVTFGVVGTRRFLSSLIDITGQFEVQRMALRNMLQDIDAADKIYQDLYRFSSESTYRFSELAKYAKQLAAFNIPKEDLLETTKMLGDVASGVGVSMDRIILAYGHVKSSGFLRGIQLRSFSQNGVPVLEELSKILTEVEGKTVSLGDVFDKMMRRQIPFEMVEQAFKNMTSEGGKFYQMQEVLAKTLAGQINILKGRWENMLAAIGQANSGILKDTVSSVSNLISSLDNVGKMAKKMVAAFGAYAAGVAIARIAIDGFGTSMLNVGIVLEKFYLALMRHPYAIVGAALAAITIEIIRHRKALEDSEKILSALTKNTKEYEKAVEAEKIELNALFAAIKNAREGTEEYNSAKLALQKRFDPYIQKLREEGVEVNNLAQLYDGLAKKIEGANKQKFLESAQKDIKEAFDGVYNEIESHLQIIIKQIGNLTADQEGALRHYIRTGEKTAYFKEIEDRLSGHHSYQGPSVNGSRPMTITEDETYYEKLQALRQRLDVASITYANSMKDAARRFDAYMDGANQKAHVALTDWRRTVQETLYTLDQKFEKTFMPKENEDYFEYLERVGKHYKEVNEYKDKALEKDKQIYENELDAIRKIDQALEGNILKDVRYTKTPWNGSEKKERYTLDNVVAKIINDTEKDVNKALDKILEASIKNLDKKFKAQSKASGEWEKFLQKYGKTKSEKTGEGAAFKVSTIIGDYKQADYKVLSEYIKQLKNLETQYGKNTAAYNNNKKKLDEWKKTMEQLNRADFVEKIRQLGDDFFKEGMLGYDLTNLGDKSLGQLLEIRDALDALDIPGDVKALLQDKYPDALEKLVNSLLPLAGQKKDKSLTPEIEKELRQEASFAAREISGLADSIEELAAASGDTKLAGLASELKDVAGVASDALSAFEQFGGAKGGGYAAGWVAIVVGFAQMVLKAGLAQEAAMNRFVENSRALRSLIKTQSEDRSSIFGESDTSVISSRLQSLQKIRKDIDSYRGEESGIDIITQRYSWLAKVLGYLNAENWTGKSVGSGDYMVTDSVSKLSKLVEGLGLELYDRYGNLNADSLQAILDTYEDIGKREREWIEDAIQDSKDYAEVMADVEDILSSIFGDIASDAADAIIDQWKEAGNAALDYADILDDVATRYAKMLIQSAILDKVLNKERADEIANMFVNGRTDEAMAGIANDMQRISEMEPLFAQILSMFDPYFNDGDSLDGNSLGAGIKSITEETASLLASYINAMRADLSYMRGLQERGWANIEQLTGVVTPSLAEYIQQIAANTYNTAADTNRILTELQSVIGAEGSSGSIVRVQLA